MEKKPTKRFGIFIQPLTVGKKCIYVGDITKPKFFGDKIDVKEVEALLRKKTKHKTSIFFEFPEDKIERIAGHIAKGGINFKGNIVRVGDFDKLNVPRNRVELL